MPNQILALTLCVEWIVLATTATPLLLFGRGKEHPLLLIVTWFAAFGSALLAGLVSMILIGSLLQDRWTAFAAKPISLDSGIAIWHALLVSIAPWLLLATAGIAVALANQRLAPLLAGARLLQTELAPALTPLRRFEGVQVLTLASPAALSFTLGSGRAARIVISTGALATINDDELAAVLWHEHGHVRQRHNALKSAARTIANLSGRMVASRIMVAEVESLCEIAADQYAAKRVGSKLVQSARAKFR